MVEAAVCIAVCVDPKEGPFHFIEDGACYTQIIALAAHSLGLSSCWIRVFNLNGEKGSAEEKTEEILEVPKTYSLISIFPVGIKKYVPEKEGPFRTRIR